MQETLPEVEIAIEADQDRRRLPGGRSYQETICLEGSLPGETTVMSAMSEMSGTTAMQEQTPETIVRTEPTLHVLHLQEPENGRLSR